MDLVHIWVLLVGLVIIIYVIFHKGTNEKLHEIQGGKYGT